jgi:hypothetical protein
MGYMDQIPVTRGHLESIQEALDAANAYFGALDLADAARTVGAHSRQSRIAALMEQNLSHVSGYLTPEGEDELPQG